MAQERPALNDLTSQTNIAPAAPAKNDSKPVNQSNTGKKRGRVEEPQDFGDSNFLEAVEDMPIDKNPDQVRRMIHRLIDNGGMKYAWAYFKYREMNGIKLPTANSGSKKQKTDGADESGSKDASKDTATGAADLADIHLPGEEDAVKVYDTCDEVRKKITAYVKKPGVTQAQFCRDLSAMYTKPTKITAPQLANFRGKKGANAGNTTVTFYAAYCFFEKLRLKEGKPKSKFRLEMEDIWVKRGSFDLKFRHDRGYLCTANVRPSEDKYGQIHFL
ncbi:hypothetical protein BFW01_g3163 [Lasiodiplodia theobromae]|nr:hypothetical protein BFW01_g3163 [Lasiodiplodia theobromae]